MQQLVLLLIIGVVLADSGAGAAVDPGVGLRWLPLVIALVPPLIVLGVELVLVRGTLNRAALGDLRALHAAGRRLRLMQWLAVGSTVLALLGFGWLELLRASIGDLVVIDELIAILPGLVVVTLLWAVQWPVERLVQESLVIRRLDRGLPVRPVPSAGSFLLVQIRMHLLVVLVPAVLVLACVELSEVVVRQVLPPDRPDWLAGLLVGAASLTALLLSPLAITRAVGARPLAPGPLRDALQAVIDQARVRVRDIRVWPTGGTALNGAVIGFIPGLRQVLLTDALLETLPRDELRAVMAHEVGHLSHRHLPWIAAVVIALVWSLGTLLEWIARPLLVGLIDAGGTVEDSMLLLQGSGTVLILLGTYLGFGVVSRRFERQADAAAARALSTDCEESAAQGTVTHRAAASMAGALETVSRLNGIDPARHTWRHGSIRWRQRHLADLVGRPVERLPIDRSVRSLKGGVLLVLIGLGLVFWLDPAREPVPEDAAPPARTALEVPSTP